MILTHAKLMIELVGQREDHEGLEVRIFIRTQIAQYAQKPRPVDCAV